MARSRVPPRAATTPASVPERTNRRDAAVTTVVCASLLIIFFAASAIAIRGKSSTYDEPMHALAGWVHLHRGDWRIDYEDPPLWQYWAALPHGAGALHANFDSPSWRRIPTSWSEQWPWTVETLYRMGNDGEAFVQRCRTMMILLGAVLGVVIAVWGWRIGGRTTAVAATVLYAFDPNVLAHAALVKNDVALALCMLLLSLALWRMGRRLTAWSLAGAAAACAAAMVTKFSGVVLAPLCVMSLLAIRVLVPEPWPVGSRILRDARARAAVAAGCVLVIGIACVAGIWAAYGGRFTAASDPTVRIDRAFLLDDVKRQAIRASFGNDVANVRDVGDEIARVAEARAAAWEPDRPTRVLFRLLDRQLFPEAWLAGLVLVHSRSQMRWSYLDGQLSIVGFRRYFPLAILYKTPLATLAALAFAAAVATWLVSRGRDHETTEPFWLGSCLLLAPALHLAMAIGSNFNIGFRHLLPMYPPLFLAAGWALERAIRTLGRPALVVASLLGTMLAIESVASAPDYLTFFNAAAGGARGGLRRLGDSNLDWGQDLPLLAAWQRRHPTAKLHLSYFGLTPPDAYGIAYENMPGGYKYGPVPVVPADGDGVVAISATTLQCIYLDEDQKALYRRFGNRVPTEVLGGSIYLYDLREPPSASIDPPCGRIAGAAKTP